ncbi:peptide transporter Ptr2p [[Candida] railenensis]|uniref:Peptide transporter Ptr2p n=1 Tax=[Candida] railenensis TaxID=45579 RepID=A0A9P0QR17_9ASCO|nr:peptide transporter Ptr2p [[Candida] railenensis]
MTLDEKETALVENQSFDKVSTGEHLEAFPDDQHYDYEDPKNYFDYYIDEHNPRGLRRPTKEEYGSLRRILGHAPYVAYLLCLVELAERGSYYGVTGCLANFIQRPLPKDGNSAGAPTRGTSESAGALGKGLQAASGLTLLLTFLAYVTPLYGGFIADTKFGKFKAIWIGVIVGAISHVLFIIAALPTVISGGAALAPTIIAILTLAVGTGFIKPNLLPLLMDQYPVGIDVVKVLPSGEKVIVDRQKTLERMTLVFYWSINVGAFLQLATSYCERLIGFWLAFLIPGILYFVMPIVLIYLKPRVTKTAPEGTVLTQAWRVTAVTLRGNWIKRWKNGELWEYAKPANMIARGEEYYKEKTKSPITWNDKWVLDIKQTVNACKIFVWYPIFLINDGGIGTVQTSQAGSMTTNGVPNDLFNNFNPLTIIVFIPILDYVIYPTLRKYKIPFRPVWRITFGFVLAALSQVVGAVIQYRIYKTSPCGYYATTCDEVSPLSAWLEVILFILQAASECFAMTSGYELAYTRSPPQMKGLVMAIFLFMSAVSAALSQALVSTLVDPHLIWPFAGMGIVGFVAAGIFFFQFRNLHEEMEIERVQRELYQQSLGSEENHDINVTLGAIIDDNNLEAVTSIKTGVGK